MTLRENSRGNLHVSWGGISGLSLLRSDGSRNSQMGRLSIVSGNQKQLKGGHQAWVHLHQMVLVMTKRKGWTTLAVAKDTQNEANLKGDYQVHSRKMILKVVRQGGWTMLTMAKWHSNESQKTNLDSLRAYLKMGRVTAHKEFTYSFLQDIEKVRWWWWGWWEVRTTVPSQNRVTAVLSTEESFLRTQYLKLSAHISRKVCGGTGNRRSTGYLYMYTPSWVLSSQPNLHTAGQGFQKIKLFSDWGRRIKQIFFFSGNKLTVSKCCWWKWKLLVLSGLEFITSQQY